MTLGFRYALAGLRAAARERREPALNNIALRHHVEVLTQSRRRPQISASDFFTVRALWVQTLYGFFFVAWYSRT